MPAVGLTDHGTVAGAINFIQTCREHEIKPIVGMETYFCRKHTAKTREEQPDGRKGNRHLNIIAKSYKGLQNLFAISHTACLDGYYYDPRIDFELLNEHKEDLIVTSACLSNIINWNLSIDRYKEAKKAASLFKDVFGGDFYLEMMYHGIDKEGKILPDIQKIGKELNIKILATNDSHYIKKEDAEFHETLMCVSSGKTIRDPKRIKFPYSEFYFKSQEEMYKIFKSVPSCLTNTLEVADKCDYKELVFGGMMLPKFELPKEFNSPLEYLSKLAYQGLEDIGWKNSKEHKERLKQELDDLKLVWETKSYDFATYFLIVYDIMQYAKKKDIPAGIRGSGYGSLLLRCLGITEGIDPVKAKLLWERFLGFSSQRFLSSSDFGIKD